ncbi:MAG: hypothetical protein ACRYFX_09160 [Janthinobacterium lividum]
MNALNHLLMERGTAPAALRDGQKAVSAVFPSVSSSLFSFRRPI